ncbi:MAG: hypothetical protein AAFY65_06005, partial [Pseudomonadota bacterium]
MPIFNLRLYDANPSSILSRTDGGFATWTGPSQASGTAVVTDNVLDNNGSATLADEYTGETAVADVTVGSFSATNANVESEESWLIRDTVTGEEIRVVQFNVNEGGARFTLSSKPLVAGRTYETVDFDSSVSVPEGVTFDYADFNDGIVSGTGGNDVIDVDYDGDPNGDVVDGNDQFTSATTESLFEWSQLGDNANVAGGVSQTVNGVDVSVSSSLSSGGTFIGNFEDNNGNTTETLPSGQGFDVNSTGRLFATGSQTDSTVTIDFDAVSGAGTSDQVNNVEFLITDIDGVINGGNNFQDIVRVTAFDVDGNPVPVDLTVLGNDVLNAAGDQVTGTIDSDEPNQTDGAIRVSIPGPVSQVVVTYDNGGDTQQAIFFSDIRFDSVSSQGNADSIEAGGGNDIVDAGADNDTVSGGTGNDTIDGGSGDDILSGDSGNDQIDGGSGNDTLDGG